MFFIITVYVLWKKKERTNHEELEMESKKEKDRTVRNPVQPLENQFLLILARRVNPWFWAQRSVLVSSEIREI